MANLILTEELALTVAFNTKENLPILEGRRINRELSDRLEQGSGSTVSVLVPGVNNVVQGSAVDPNASIQVQKVPITVNQYNISAPFDRIDDTLNLKNFQKQVSEPNAAKLASSINTGIFNAVGGGACNAAIVQDLGGLSDSAAVIKSSRIGGALSAMLNPQATSRAVNGNGQNSGAFGWKANSSVGLSLYNGVIGNYFGVDVFESPDAYSITGVTVAGTVGAISDGDSSLSITSTAAVTIPAGTPLQVANVYTVDAFGNPIGARAFITTQTVTLVAGTATAVPVGKIYLVGGSFPIPNTLISGTPGAVASMLTGGKLYATGLVMAANAGAFAAIQPAPFPGTTQSISTRLANELNIRTSINSNLDTGISRWRFDVIWGATSLYGQGAVMIYVPLN